MVTASGVQALNVGIRCALDPGDEALVLTPAWPNGSSIVAMANATPLQIPHPLLRRSLRHRFRRARSRRDAAHAAAAVHVAFESAGLGGDRRGAAAPARFRRRHGLWLMADEVYDRLYYAGARLGDPVPSILRKATRDDAVMVVHSFSKSYCMTGWRVGWLVARARSGREGDAVERIHRFARAEFRAEGRRKRRWPKARKNCCACWRG